MISRKDAKAAKKTAKAWIPLGDLGVLARKNFKVQLGWDITRLTTDSVNDLAQRRKGRQENRQSPDSPWRPWRLGAKKLQGAARMGHHAPVNGLDAHCLERTARR